MEQFHRGWQSSGSSGANGTSYYLKYKKKVGFRGRTNVSGWVDLDLPVGEKCSWWWLDGYDPCESEVEEADPQAPLNEEMDVDSEEEGHRSDKDPIDSASPHFHHTVWSECGS